MSYLYVQDNKAKIGIEANRITVHYANGMVKKVPVETLESINIFGNAQMTSQCVHTCLLKGIQVVYYSVGGSYFGRLESTGHVNVERQRMQDAVYNTDFALAIGKKMIGAKVHNQSVILSRYARSRQADCKRTIALMKGLMEKVQNSASIPQMMGFEGRAAKMYFEELGKLVEPDFTFNGRNRRSPLDPFNCMISLGYSLVMNEFYGKIQSRGLNPYFGLVHQDKERHPTLASDMMEEWRAVIVDSVALSLINGHEISLEEFYKLEDKPGIFLNDEGMRIILKKLDIKMRTETKYLESVVYRTSFRQAMELQVDALVHAIEERDPEKYQPVWIR